MLSHTFDQCGVYYFSDISGNECASYIGIVAVKKKPEQHVINYKEEAKRFEQGKKKSLELKNFKILPVI